MSSFQLPVSSFQFLPVPGRLRIRLPDALQEVDGLLVALQELTEIFLVYCAGGTQSSHQADASIPCT